MRNQPGIATLVVGQTLDLKPNFIALTHNQTMQLTATRRDDHLEFMKQIVDVAKFAPASGS
jgi:hypothetical protein